MTERIVEFSVKNRFLVIIITLMVGVIGWRSMQELPIDAVPDITNIQVQILTNAPSLGPEDVEQFITFPVETVMSGLPNLEEVRSVSRFGLSAVTIVFEEGTDIYFARQLVQERLADAREAIPQGYGTPEMGPISSGLGEIYQFEVRGEPVCAPDEADTPECFSPMELRETLDWFVSYQVRSIPGVVEVNSFGGQLKTFEVSVFPERLVAFDLGLEDIFSALRKNNLSAGGGYIVHSGEQRLIRGSALLGSLGEIEEVVVTTRSEGTPIRIADLAEVKLAPQIRQGAVTRDGRGEVVTGIVMMLMGENSREVSAAVDTKIKELASSLPKGITIETFYDRTDLVDRTIHTVSTNLLEGGLLVILILFLLLGNLRGGLLVASSIPLSMLATFIAMNAFGVSGNLMSLGALDFGLIVDGSVVMVEHVVLVLAVSTMSARTENIEEAVIRASREVARPIAFAVAIIMLVYVPILSLKGIEGKMFQPMALTVIFALFASLVLSLTFMPAMATIVFRKGVKEKDTLLLRMVKKAYLPSLDWVMKKRFVVIAATLLSFAGAAIIIPFLGAEFIPRLDEGAIAMQSVRLPSVPLEESIRFTTMQEAAILEHFPDEVETVVSRTGRAEIATDPMGVEISDVFIMLKPISEWTKVHSKERLVEEMQKVLKHEVPGQNYLFSQPIELRTNELISGVRADVAIKIYGDDIDVLAKLAEEMESIIADVPGAGDVESEQVSGLPFLRVRVNRPALARYGVSAQEVMNAVSTIAGVSVGEIFEGQRRFSLQVRLTGAARDDLSAIRSIPIATPSGTTLPLGELAELSFEEGPAQIGRENVQRRVAIMANVRGRDLASFVADAQKRIATGVTLPAGYTVEWGGQFKNLEEATARLALAVPAALTLIFLLLYMAYSSGRVALLIYVNVPFAAIGGVYALFIRGMPFSISAGVGFIALFGIAVLNGVVLVSHIQDLQKEGMPVAMACAEGSKMRLRAVLMTALTDGIGFLPMAISSGAGAEVQRPLATVVMGGLVTSTLLTLFVLPTMYAWLGPKEIKTD